MPTYWPKRKAIEFDADTWVALDLLAKEKKRSLQQLAREAFADLLAKYHRPVTLAEALKASAGVTKGKGAKPRGKTRAP